jgi:hypothetical protein
MCFSFEFGSGAKVADPDVQVTPGASEFESTNAASDHVFPDRGVGVKERKEGVADQ